MKEVEEEGMCREEVLGRRRREEEEEECLRGGLGTEGSQLWEGPRFWGRDPMTVPLRLRAMRRRFSAL